VNGFELLHCAVDRRVLPRGLLRVVLEQFVLLREYRFDLLRATQELFD
jgi:hypothetical protein